MKERKTKKKSMPYALLIAAVMVAGIIGLFGDSTKAADSTNSLIIVDNYDHQLSSSTTVSMETSSLTLRLRQSDGQPISASDDYKISWSIMDSEQRERADLITADTVSEDGTVNPDGLPKTAAILKAKSPGNVSITVIVIDTTNENNILLDTTCNINIKFAIDTSTDVNLFKLAKSTDTSYSMIMEQTHAPVQLGLSFGDTENTQWSVDKVDADADEENSEEIIKVDKNTGVVTPVAAGKARVRATYRKDLTEYTATMDVYILPRVSTQNEEDMSNYKKSLTVALDSGDSLFTNTLYTTESEPVRSKIVWTISQEDGKGNMVKIADSIGMESDLIELVPAGSYNNELVVNGTAGKYQIKFYAYDTYDESQESGTLAYNPTVVNLTIKTSIEDKTPTLSIGDSYNFAEAYHMTLDDFKECFGTPTFSLSGAGDLNDYVSYDPATATLTALKDGTVKATLTVVESKKSYIRELLGLDEGKALPDCFVTTISIADRIQMDRTSMTISVGQTYQLSVRGNMIGTYTWKSSDSKYVSVDDNGKIKGIKVTTSSVTISATIDAGDGVYREATCLVKVEAAVTSFTLSPKTDQTLLVGDYLVVKAEIKQTVTVAPLNWMSSNEKIFTVEQSEDGKSATIKAVSGGDADLVVYNTVTESKVTLHITVRVAISTIKFKNSSLSLAQYTKGYNLVSDMSYTPTNPTDKTMTWSSSDTSVLTVDSNGYVTFKNPGTALVTVYPAYNPYNIMASCQITVYGTPTGMKLSESEISMNVKESVTVDVNFTPSNTMSDLTWKPNDTSIVTISYDTTKKIATFTGKSPGTTDVNVIAADGLVSNIKVTVRQPATAVSIKEKDVTILSGSSTSLTAVLTPTNSTDTLTWTSEDTKIATVDASGKVTGVKPGTTYINVTAYNNGVQTCFAHVTVTVRDAVTGITLPQSEYAMVEGDSITIEPKILPETAYNQKINWKLSNSNVVTLSPVKGSDTEIEVTAVAAGSAMLTVVTEDGSFQASCVIVVAPAPTPTPEPTEEPTEEPSATPEATLEPTDTPEPTAEPTATPTQVPTPTPYVEPTKVKVNPTTKTLKVGKSFYIKATVTGTTKNKKVKWTSSKKKVCTVTQSGKVKGKKVGTAYIKATARDGSKASARCKVRVIRPVTKIKLKPTSAKILAGDILKVKATVKPKNATIKKIKWTTKDASIATVDSTGKVIGVAPGMVEIKAKAQDGFGKVARCYVTVKELVEATGVTVENSSITLAKGKAKQSGIVAAPENTTTSIRYYSDNKKVASIDQHGKIKTHKVGQATVYGETANGKIGYCDVLVVDLNRKGVVLRQYDTEQLQVNEISDGVTWYSKDISIATVDSSGLVTGRKKGSTIVYAVVNGVKLGCRVKVKKIK
jgi:uncharacterized protein YjdB